MVTTWSFSISASLRSGMLTTMRRVIAASAVRVPSAAALGLAKSTAAVVVARIQSVRFVLMSPSVLGTTGATPQPSHNYLIQLTLLDSTTRNSVSGSARRVRADTLL